MNLSFLQHLGLPGHLGLLFVIALVVSSLGFFRVAWFVSLGYAFSIAIMAVVVPILFRDVLDVGSALHNIGLLLYGLRLGSFLVKRERNAGYQRRQKEKDEKRGAHITGTLKLAIWTSVSLLYVLMFCPALYALLARRAAPASGILPSEIPGLALMAAGLGLEALADHQKSAFKQESPDRFCDVGLFRFARCPNYFGEVVFWVGQWIAGISAYGQLVHWATSLLGLAGIVLVMLGSTRRLELEQDERYGADPAYQKYTRTVPVLFPFVPIHSFRNLKVYLG